MGPAEQGRRPYRREIVLIVKRFQTLRVVHPCLPKYLYDSHQQIHRRRGHDLKSKKGRLYALFAYLCTHMRSFRDGRESCYVPERPYANHGSTVASWVMIAIMTAGVLVGAVAYDLAQPVIVFVGAGIIVLGLVAG